ncbi:hypothetical protein CBL_02752 [Carabus blaptoides fortunei]
MEVEGDGKRAMLREVEVAECRQELWKSRMLDMGYLILGSYVQVETIASPVPTNIISSYISIHFVSLCGLVTPTEEAVPRARIPRRLSKALFRRIRRRAQEVFMRQIDAE